MSQRSYDHVTSYVSVSGLAAGSRRLTRNGRVDQSASIELRITEHPELYEVLHELAGIRQLVRRTLWNVGYRIPVVVRQYRRSSRILTELVIEAIIVPCSFAARRVRSPGLTGRILIILVRLEVKRRSPRTYSLSLIHI